MSFILTLGQSGVATGKTPFKCKCQIGSATFRFFVDAGENLIIANNVVTPSNPPIAPVEKEKLEDAPLDETPFNETPLNKTPLDKAPLDEAPLDKAPLDKTPLDETPLNMNVSQWSREEESSRGVVRTRIDHSA